MIPYGSRLLLGATALATFVAVLYATVEWGSLGTTGLIFLAVACALLTGIVLYTRESDVSVKDPTAATHAAAAQPAPQPSLWPIVGAGAAVLLVVGLVTYPVVFIFGVIALLATTIEWMIGAWSERATGDRLYNSGVRERTAHPAEFPVLAALVVGIIIYSFSRIMLFLSKTGGPVAFAVIAALVLVVGFLVAYRPQLRNATVSGVAAIALLGLVAGGVAAALAGERDIEEHETTGYLAEHGECATPEATHADDKASQTIGAKANIFAEITLRADGSLVAQSTGIEGESDVLVLQRANPTNLVFHNESPDARRLTLDLGTAPATDGTADDEAEPIPVQICTALVEEGGKQFLTFSIGAPAAAETPYRFFVPGVEDQSIEVVIP